MIASLRLSHHGRLPLPGVAATLMCCEEVAKCEELTFR
jgi:hypothetical protein